MHMGSATLMFRDTNSLPIFRSLYLSYSQLSGSQSRRHHGLSESCFIVRLPAKKCQGYCAQYQGLGLPTSSKYTDNIGAGRHQGTPRNRQGRTRSTIPHLFDTCVCPSPCHHVTEMMQMGGRPRLRVAP